MLHNGTSGASHPDATVVQPVQPVQSSSHLDDVELPSHLVAYSKPEEPLSATPATTPAPTANNDAVAGASTPPAAPATRPASPPPGPVVVGQTERGLATWYPEALPGRCASTWLPFGTVLTVTNDATGASTTCLVDDREMSPYPRLVDLSYSGFAQLDPPSIGVVEVTVSW